MIADDALMQTPAPSQHVAKPGTEGTQRKRSAELIQVRLLLLANLTQDVELCWHS